MILYLPLISFFICIFFGRRVGYIGSKIISTSCLLISVLISLFIFFNWNSKVNISIGLFNWFDNGLLSCIFSLYIDHLNSCMLILITVVSFLVHLFSTSYMDGDPHVPRFMGYLSLFTFFMIVLVTADNLVQMFIGWEGVGLTSYLLINFWYTRIQANKAAIKAMVVNKIGDVGFLIGVVSLWKLSGLFNFQDSFNLTIINDMENHFNWINVMFIIGVMAKSAQIGLHMWLPDAMEGPTPVSALIHAATMVTAGVFLIIRVSPLLELTPLVLLIIVMLGSLTCFMSGTMGLVQSDLKKVIAYSTCSQLGYMVMICGFSYYYCGLFHLFNHGFFKALLFLSAGSIIHAVNNEQDMRKSGGLKLSLPLSYISVIIGSLSLCGLPFLTGFYSKDLLIELIFSNHYLYFALWLGIITAFLTSFYSFRLIYYSFFFSPSITKRSYIFVHEGSWNLFTPLLVLILLSVFIGYFSSNYVLMAYENPIIKTLPKSYPLIVTVIGISVCIFIFYYFVNFWKLFVSDLLFKIYNFLIKVWYWDPIKGNYFGINLLNIGFIYTYKVIDNQFIEKLGPLSNYYTVLDNSSNSSYYYSGKMSSYVLALIFFILILF